MNFWSKVRLALTAWSGTAPAAQQPGPVPPGALAGRLGTVALVLACLLGSLAPCRLHAQTTTITLQSSPNPSAFNQQVTFTAIVTGNTVPGIGVIFSYGSTTLCVSQLVAEYEATCTYSALPVGSNSISASYMTYVSNTIIQTVKKATTTTTVTSSANPSTLGQGVTFKATVTGQFGGTPTGTVEFDYGSTFMCSVPLSGAGTASCSFAALPAGSDTVTAEYYGDANFYSSLGTVTQTVNRGSSVTTATSSPNPSAPNQQVTFTAQVNNGGLFSATGTVTFSNGSTTLCNAVPLSGAGTATCAYSALPVGLAAVTAAYSGDANFTPSSGTALQTVQPTTTTTLISSANPSMSGSSVTFTATVTASPSGTPTGTVTFWDGATTLGTSSLNASGVATYATSSLAVGQHSIQALYSPVGFIFGSTSAVLSQTVNKASTTVTLASSANPSAFGSSVTFTTTVTPATATGTVTFKDGTTTLGTSMLSSGVTTYATSSLAVGQHSISAVYGGDANNAGSTSAVLTQTVNATPATTTTNVVSSANPSVSGSAVTFTATVTTSGSKTPTGAATFLDGSATLGTGTLNSSGTATYSTSTLAVGSHSITAVYGGDANNAGSTSSVLSQTVNALTNLTVTPTVLTFNFQTGGAAPATQSVSVGSSGGALNYTVTSSTVTGGSWLSATPTSSTTPSTATVSVDTTGLTAGTYTGNITITSSGAANSPQTIPVTLVVSQTAPSLSFVPVAPCRVVDTRDADGPFGGPALFAGQTRSFVIPSSACSIPPTAAAYALNFTVVPHGELGYLSVWPTGESQPLVSTLNSPDGRTKANAAIMPAGSGGAISVYATDDTDVVVDISGYFLPVTSDSSLAFFALAPCRVVDTRNANGALGGPYMPGGQERPFPVLASSCGVPAYAQAYSLNFTVVPHVPLSFLTVWPSGESRPWVSTLNAPTGTAVANAAIVPAGISGQVSVYVTDDADVVIDVNGYFAPASSGSNPLWLYNVTPCRVLDTRSTGASLPLTIAVAGTCSVPSAAEAYVFNATVVPQGPLYFLTLWPAGTTEPVVSTLNAMDGVITSNMAIVPGSNGSIEAASEGTTALVLDITGCFAP